MFTIVFRLCVPVQKYKWGSDLVEGRKYVIVYLLIYLFLPYCLLLRLSFAWYVCYDMLQFKCTKDAGKLSFFFLSAFLFFPFFPFAVFKALHCCCFLL